MAKDKGFFRTHGFRHKTSMRFRHASLFLKEFLQTPHQVGSVWQSSSALTGALTSAADQRSSNTREGLIVDLGAGTGVVTKRLLDVGYAPQQIVAIERSSTLASVIRQQWPHVHTVADDAVSALESLKKSHGQRPLQAVISSLPLRNFPKAEVHRVMQAVYESLQEHGCLVQYSYALWQQFPLRFYGFQPVERSLVFRNLPPACVEVYVRI